MTETTANPATDSVSAVVSNEDANHTITWSWKGIKRGEKVFVKRSENNCHLISVIPSRAGEKDGQQKSGAWKAWTSYHSLFHAFRWSKGWDISLPSFILFLVRLPLHSFFCCTHRYATALFARLSLVHVPHTLSLSIACMSEGRIHLITSTMQAAATGKYWVARHRNIHIHTKRRSELW